MNAATPTFAPSGINIPDVPVNAIVVDPANSNILYAGTDIGVYQSTNGGANWNPYGAGLPRVTVFDLAFQAGTGVLRAATHGRGIWQIGPSGQGEVPASTLRMGKSVTAGNLTANWGASCTTATNNYAIQEGTLGNWYSHAGLVCATGNVTSFDFTPGGASRYYLVIATDGNYEGSYGVDSNGTVIPPSQSPCRTQAVTNTCG
jgi:hypothetical protein